MAVDAERASGFRYGHRAFLVQLRRQGAGTVLIDPVACPDLSGLDAALAGTEAVLHAASQDLPCLADLGYRPRQLFDTELAGRLLGYPRVGLGPLVENVLGLGLEKGTRPPTGPPARCPRTGSGTPRSTWRSWWSCATRWPRSWWRRARTSGPGRSSRPCSAAGPPPPRPDPWRRTSGIHRVRNRRGLAIVRELWLERDKIARRRDLSPGRVLPDSAIVEAARAAPASAAELIGCRASRAGAPGGTSTSGSARSAGPTPRPTRPCPARGAGDRRPAARAPLARA